MCRRRKTSIFFFTDVVHILSAQKTTCKYIVVVHIVKTLPNFLNALAKIGDVVAVIPKSSIPDDKVNAWVRTNFPIFDINREKMRTDREYVNNKFSDIFKDCKNDNNKVVIVDIGGYFASCIMHISALPEYVKLVGIVEDTENGYQKYENELQKCKEQDLHIPLLSVARIQLKEAEDYNVGKSIVRAADTILRTDAHTLIERKPIIGVIGFGKIGRSIAQHLRGLDAQRVIVCENQPLIALQAASLGFYVVSLAQLAASAYVIFSATGNNVLRNDHYSIMRDGVFIASCTSREDEFSDLNTLQLIENDSTTHIKVFAVPGKNRKINFMCNGNAVNFAYNGVNGPYIYAVQASLLWAAAELAHAAEKKILSQQQQPIVNDKIQPLCVETQRRIAQLWLKNFAHRSWNFVTIRY